jgi:maleylacetate reductase
MRFEHEGQAAMVVFGTGRAIDAVAEVEKLGGRPMVIVDESAAEISRPLLERVGNIEAHRITRVRQHVPVEDAESARSRAAEVGAHSLLAVGGGSAIGLAKAVALTTGLPIVAVPTTYAGSEMTPVWGMTENEVKTTGRDTRVAPKAVVYDPELTYSLPPEVTAASGLNAVAHCVDSLWAEGRDPLTETMAERGIASLAQGLPAAIAEARGEAPRSLCLVGAWLAASAFAGAGSSLHHKLCHVLGGRFNLPHADTHAVVLPWATRLAVRHVPEAGAVIGRALGSEDPVVGLRALSVRLGAPQTLAELGLTRAQALEVADDLPLDRLATPFEVDRDDLRELLLGATEGEPT